MTLAQLLDAVDAERRMRGARFNTIVCRPQHLEAWSHVGFPTLRLLFAEHGLRLQVDAGSPWNQAALLWIEPESVHTAA